MKKLFILLILITAIFAEMPNTIAYRGQLTDETGNALDATVDITFNIFDVASGGTSLWSATQSVSVTDGYFDIELGSVTALDLNFDSQYWVELTIDGETLSPRDKLTPTAFAIRSNIANKADSTIYSVSSSADHSGRIGHVRFIPGDGGSITEAAASSETDTIYIAIGGGTGSTTSGAAYPAANKIFGNQGYINASTTNHTLYTVPENHVFYLYSIQLQMSHISGGFYIWIAKYDGSARYNIASSSNYGNSYGVSNSLPTNINFERPIIFNAGESIEYSINEFYAGGCFYGYHITGYEEVIE